MGGAGDGGMLWSYKDAVVPVLKEDAFAQKEQLLRSVLGII